MAVTETQIRNIINIPSPNDLSDASVTENLNRARTFVDNNKKVGTPSSLSDLAILNLGAYLAYLTYADRVINILPGSVGPGGLWTPSGEVQQRDVKTKLDHLKLVSDETLALITKTAKKKMFFSSVATYR